MLRHFGVSAPFDGLHLLVSSPVVSPAILAGIRILFAVYTLYVLIFSLVWSSVFYHVGQQFFSFFTHLSYIGLCAYFFAAGVQTALYSARGCKAYPLQSWPRVLQLLHALLVASIISLPIVITIVFWSLLAGPDTFTNWFDIFTAISMHVLNTVFALFEIGFTNLPPLPWATLVFPLFSLAGFIGVAYITHATQGFYPYEFLDISKQHIKVLAYMAGIAVAECLVFALVRGLMILRQRITKRAGQSLLSATVPTSRSIELFDSIEEVKDFKGTDVGAAV